MSGTNGASPPLPPVVGIVDDVNPKGVKVGGSWLNFSKYSSPPIVPPALGQRVELRLDKGGYVRACRVIPANVAAESAPTFAYAPADLDDIPDLDGDLGEPDEPAPADLVDRAIATTGPLASQRLKVRQTAVQAAFSFIGTRQDLRAADAFQLAEAIERWVLRCPA